MAIKQIARIAMPGQHAVTLEFNPNGAMGACYRVTVGQSQVQWATLENAYDQFKELGANVMRAAGWIIEAGGEVTA